MTYEDLTLLAHRTMLREFRPAGLTPPQRCRRSRIAIVYQKRCHSTVGLSVKENPMTGMLTS